jgi:hypothetical protein
VLWLSWCFEKKWVGITEGFTEEQTFGMSIVMWTKNRFCPYFEGSAQVAFEIKFEPISWPDSILFKFIGQRVAFVAECGGRIDNCQPAGTENRFRHA